MKCRNKVLIGFIGAGNMGSAIMKGIAKSDLCETHDLSACDPNADKLEALAKYNVTPLKSAGDVVDTCKYVFLAVKPQVMEDVLNSIKSNVTKDTVIVSIAAGIDDNFIKSKTRRDAKVILVMPNTPLLLGEGAVAMAKCDGVTDDEFDTVKNIFESCGVVSVLDKSKMKEIITINSSSPAYIYLFAKGFIDYGKSVGIPEDVSTKMFAQALIGSAKMITDSGMTIDELIKMVSSPGGTTLAGLDEFYKGNLTEVVDKACKACTKRAIELSK